MGYHGPSIEEIDMVIVVPWIIGAIITAWLWLFVAGVVISILAVIVEAIWSLIKGTIAAFMEIAICISCLPYDAYKEWKR
jgi:hypothetical protein